MSSWETNVPRDAAAEAWHVFDESSRPYSNYVARALYMAFERGDAGEDVALHFYAEKTEIRVAIDILEDVIRHEDRTNIRGRYEEIKNAYEDALQNV